MKRKETKRGKILTQVYRNWLAGLKSKGPIFPWGATSGGGKTKKHGYLFQ